MFFVIARHCQKGMLSLRFKQTTQRYLSRRYKHDSSSIFNGKAKKPERILVTGSLGQIGTELIPLLRNRGHHIVATDIRPLPKTMEDSFNGVEYRYLDASDDKDLRRIVVENKITSIIHMAAKLSAVSERDPGNSFGVNTRGVENVLEVSKQFNLRVFAPSSIAAFGPATPNLHKIVDDVTIQRPLNVYGVSKLYLETLGEWYHHRYGVDFRSLRYPGILSSDTLPGGGTTDYAIEMFYAALEGNGDDASGERTFVCGVGKDRRLPMMYMPDCLKSTVQLFEAEPSQIKQGTYNVAAVSFTPDELANTLNTIIEKEGSSLKVKAKPVKISYKLDIRDQIAQTWPAALNDTNARNDWDWSHDYDMEELTRDMLKKIAIRVSRS